MLKEVFIGSGEVRGLTQFAKSTLEPGGSTTRHVHDTMTEIFYVLEGELKFWEEEEETTALEGDCVIVAPGELHALSNPSNRKATFVYFGLAAE